MIIIILVLASLNLGVLLASGVALVRYFRFKESQKGIEVTHQDAPDEKLYVRRDAYLKKSNLLAQSFKDIPGPQ